MTEHTRRKAELMRDWWRHQGSYTALHRGMAIANACAWEASRVAQQVAYRDDRAAIQLTAAQILTCEQRALSQARMHRYGPNALKPDREGLWLEQMAAIKVCLYCDDDPELAPDIGWTDDTGRAALKRAQEALA